MKKRILHLIQFTDPEQAREEVSRIYNTRESEVSIMHPLELFFSRELMIAAVEENLDAIRRNRAAAAEESALQRDYAEAVIQQRVDFLERLRSDRNNAVFLAVYPAGEDEDVIGLEEEVDPGAPEIGEDDLPM